MTYPDNRVEDGNKEEKVFFACKAVQRLWFWAHLDCEFKVTDEAIEFADNENQKYSFRLMKEQLRNAKFKFGRYDDNDLRIVLENRKIYEIGLRSGNWTKAKIAMRELTYL